jgi:hypothetical protein
MEYLEGSPLDEVIAAGPLPIERLQSLAFQLCDALQEAHSKGILHRDIKPANVFLDVKGTAKLLDFGLAKSVTEPTRATDADTIVAAVPGPESAATIEAELTQAGSMFGTLLYMSPEQFRGQELDVRSDLYSLGRVLYEAATGSVGFEGRSLGEVAEAILTGTTPLASTLRPDIPPALNVSIDRLLQKDPGERFNSAREVREAMILGQQDGATAGFHERAPRGIRTLGRTRSVAWIVAVMIASLPTSFYVLFVFFEGANASDSSLLLILGLIGYAVAWLLYRRSSVKLKQDDTLRPQKLRRLEDQDSDRGWMWGYLLPGLGAVLMTVITVRVAWKMTQDGGPSALTFFSNVLFSVMFWIPVIYARRWRKNPPSRRAQEIAIEASFPEILSRVSDAIGELEARVSGMDLDRGWISLTTSAGTWMGLGERVTIRIRESNPGVHSVALESVTITPWFPMDMGKNKKNLNTIVEILLR